MQPFRLISQSECVKARIPGCIVRDRIARRGKSNVVGSFCAAALPLFCTSLCLAQEVEAQQAAVVVRSNLVMVPVLAMTKQGKVLLDLNARDFVLTDNGVPQ